MSIDTKAAPVRQEMETPPTQDEIAAFEKQFCTKDVLLTIADRLQYPTVKRNGAGELVGEPLVTLPMQFFETATNWAEKFLEGKELIEGVDEIFRSLRERQLNLRGLRLEVADLERFIEIAAIRELVTYAFVYHYNNSKDEQKHIDAVLRETFTENGFDLKFLPIAYKFVNTLPEEYHTVLEFGMFARATEETARNKRIVSLKAVALLSWLGAYDDRKYLPAYMLEENDKRIEGQIVSYYIGLFKTPRIFNLALNLLPPGMRTPAHALIRMHTGLHGHSG